MTRTPVRTYLPHPLWVSLALTSRHKKCEVYGKCPKLHNVPFLSWLLEESSLVPHTGGRFLSCRGVLGAAAGLPHCLDSGRVSRSQGHQGRSWAFLGTQTWVLLSRTPQASWD